MSKVKVGDIVNYVVQLRLGDRAIRPALVVAVDDDKNIGVQVFTNSDAYGNGGDFVPGVFWRYPVIRENSGQVYNTWYPREEAERSSAVEIAPDAFTESFTTEDEKIIPAASEQVEETQPVVENTPPDEDVQTAAEQETGEEVVAPVTEETTTKKSTARKNAEKGV